MGPRDHARLPLRLHPGNSGVRVDAYAQLGIKLDSGRGRTGTGLLPVDADGRPEDEYSEAGGAVKARVSQNNSSTAT